MEAMAESAAAHSRRKGLAHYLETLGRPDVFKPCLLIMFLMVLMAWSGGNAIMGYAVNIFKVRLSNSVLFVCFGC